MKKILFYDMGAYTQKDIADTMIRMGHTVKSVLYKLRDITEDTYFEKRICDFLKDGYDCVFSVNFFPILARICKDKDIPYISWTYDSPVNVPDIEKYLAYPTSFAFFFDRSEALRLCNKGLERVYHLPLAVNCERMTQCVADTNCKQLGQCNDGMKDYRCDISVVGQLYDSVLPTLMQGMGEYEKGYISALMEAQLQIYGADIVRGAVSDDLVERINRSFKDRFGDGAIGLNKEGLAVTISKHITHLERIMILDEVSTFANTYLYGPDFDESLSNVKYKGSAGYFDEMPVVFNKSKINFNITLRCIESGIPLRALDIMGSGGFLLSNFQPELAEYFEDGCEIVMYNDIPDAIEKCRFYLENDDLREKIARAGHEKVKELFRYEDRIDKMLGIVF